MNLYAAISEKITLLIHRELTDTDFIKTVFDIAFHYYEGREDYNLRDHSLPRSEDPFFIEVIEDCLKDLSLFKITKTSLTEQINSIVIDICAKMEQLFEDESYRKLIEETFTLKSLVISLHETNQDNSLGAELQEMYTQVGRRFIYTENDSLQTQLLSNFINWYASTAK